MKKIFSLFVALMAVFSLSAKTLYLKPNADWKTANARFAIYTITDEKWLDMEAVEGEDGIFKAEVGETIAKVIFCRMNPKIAENRWNQQSDGDNKPLWNQTQDMTLEEGKDQCNIIGWDKGEWAKHGEAVVEPKFFVTGDSALVVDAGLTVDKAWNPNSIRSDKDTLALTLKADQDYLLKITVDGSWNTAKGFAQLTDTAAGLKPVDDGKGGKNIGFKLKAAGEVKVIYTTEVFKLIGDFVVPEPDPEPEVKVLPVVELVGEMNEWHAQALTPAEDSLTASIKVTLAVDSFDFKILSDGKYLTLDAINNNYEIKRDHNAPEKRFGELGKDTRLIADVAGEYIFTWKYADSTIVVTFPEQVGPEPEKLADGYYLIADPWELASLSEDVLFAANPGKDGEFLLVATLTEGQKIKVVSIENEAFKTWFPDGMGKEYTVDVAHAGEKTIYFEPTGNDAWKEFHEGGFFFIEANPTAIDNTAVDSKAVKTIENGMLIIRREGKTYNVLGVEIR